MTNSKIDRIEKEMQKTREKITKHLPQIFGVISVFSVASRFGFLYNHRNNHNKRA